MSWRWVLAVVFAATCMGAALWHVVPAAPAPAPGPAQGARDARRAREPVRGGVQGARGNVDASARVWGAVVDDAGEPVTGGAVLLQCLRADSVRPLGTLPLDADGGFEGRGCRGVVCASLQHPSQSPASAWVLTPGSVANLRTAPLRQLWGRVQTPSGEPAQGATVTFSAATPPDERDPRALLPLISRTTTTDAEGRFSVAWIRRPPCGPCEEARGGCRELPPLFERLRITASTARAAATSRDWDTADARGSSADAPVVLRLALAEDLLTGRLLDPAGRPYPRAFVLARSQIHAHLQRRAEVDRLGDFELDGLGQGLYDLRALQDGVELAVAEAAAGEDVQLEGTRLADGRALEVVVVEDDAPVPSARVDGGPFRDAKTDMQGTVRAFNTLSGMVALRVRNGAQIVRARVFVPEPSAAPTGSRHRVRIDLGTGRSSEDPGSERDEARQDARTGL